MLTIDNQQPEHSDEKLAGVLVTKLICSSITLLAAIGAIVLIELEALKAGIDGKVLTACVGAVCLIVGVGAKDVFNLIRGKSGRKK